jgi:hypothetical protein
MNHVPIVFDDDHRVSLTGEVPEHFQKPSGVPRVETDGGFVQDVQRTHQAGPQSLGQLDALRFPPGKRARQSIEAQIPQPHTLQDLQAMFQIPDQRRDLFPIFPTQVQVTDALVHGGDRQSAPPGKGLSLHPHAECFPAKPASRTPGTEFWTLIALHQKASSRLVGFGAQAGQESKDAGKGAVSMEEQIVIFGRKILPGNPFWD